MIQNPFDEDDDAEDFIELCEESGLQNVRFTPVFNGPNVALTLDADLDLGFEDMTEIRTWLGFEDGRPSAAKRPRTWVAIDGDPYPYGNAAHREALADDYPEEIMGELWDAVTAAIRIMHDANHDLEHMRAMAVTFITEQLNSSASATWDEADEEVDSVEAFASNCAIDLYRAVTVTEATDAHLGYDIAARTLDPSTGDEKPLRVFWRTDPESRKFIHCFGIGDAWCPAHEGDEKIAELMATQPAESQHHYVHAFDHLHQLAHAASGVAEENLAVAVAMMEVEDGPLSEDDVHQLSHKVFASTLVELNPLAWSISGEPDLPAHEH